MRETSVQDKLWAGDRTGGKVYHEDIEVGKPITLGEKAVTKEEIVAFARQFDPQPMHLDEEAAKATPMGGLCASGWHTCAMMMRMLCDGPLRNAQSLGSPGVDEVRWTKPVRPGDVLTCRGVYTEKRDLASRPDVGLSKLSLDLLNANGEVVSWWRTNQLTRKRNPGPPASAQDRPKAPRQPLVSLWDLPASAGPSEEGFFEDRTLGEITDFGRHTFTREEIIDFARQFDPQPFHLDDEAAKASLFGTLCASGWHTSAIFIRGIITHRQAHARAPDASGRQPVYGPSPGFRNLRWPKPVYVGDTIEFRAQLSEKIDLKSRPDRGILVSEVQGRNQKGEIVYAVTSQILVDRREPFPAA